MRWFVVLTLFIGLNSAAQSENLSPWFGSDASDPVQMTLPLYDQKQAVSSQVSAAEVDLTCPIEGCPTEAKLVKLGE